MTSGKVGKLLTAASVVLCGAMLATDAQSLGGRGGGEGRGGGFNRAGPAAGGSFSAGKSASRPGGGQSLAGRQGAGAYQGQAQDRSGTHRQAANDRQAQRQQAYAQRDQNMTDRQQGRQEYAREAQQRRQNYGQQRQESRQDYAKDAREDWQDYDDNNGDWDNWGAVAAGTAVAAGAYAVGRNTAAPSTTYVIETPCAQMTEVIVNGVGYFRCDANWYTRSFAGGDVVYSLAAPPPGF